MTIRLKSKSFKNISPRISEIVIRNGGLGSNGIKITLLCLKRENIRRSSTPVMFIDINGIYLYWIYSSSIDDLNVETNHRHQLMFDNIDFA